MGSLRKLWRREMTVKPPNTPPGWITAKAGHHSVRAIVFAADRRGRNFAGELTTDQIATVLCMYSGGLRSGPELSCGQRPVAPVFACHGRR